MATMWQCADVLCNIATFACLHDQIHHMCLVNGFVARTVLKNTKFLMDLRDSEARPYCMHKAVAAAGQGHFVCLQYLHENQDVFTQQGSPICSEQDIFSRVDAVCTHAGARGSLECLKYAYENGYPCVDTLCCSIAQYGFVECLKYIHENGHAVSFTWSALHAVWERRRKRRQSYLY
jgi:hypothetical protein